MLSYEGRASFEATRIYRLTRHTANEANFCHLVDIDYFDHAHNTYAASGYRPELGIVLSDSYTTVQTSFENIPQAGLSISVHGLCVVDNTYCIGESVQVRGEKVKLIERLKEERIERGLSQAALGKLVGSLQPAIARMECGLVSQVSMDCPT